MITAINADCLTVSSGSFEISRPVISNVLAPKPATLEALNAKMAANETRYKKAFARNTRRLTGKTSL